jgi:adenylosuccinate synthase
VNIQYNLQELEKIFESIEDLKLDFIDSEEYLHQAQKQVNLFCAKVLKGHYRCRFWNFHL